ncbi:sensor histidine kinase [Streptomyces afghaniensis]|uniref:sensor histidine kinase n=1 Tax=Streptomyces afghaniensis TaxID=66865 RepID=UPI0027D8A40D|nr:histidine kinase [Streptomyces afghaniensis]
MRGAGTWWRRKSTPAKVETYTRWSFHTFIVIEIVAIGLVPFRDAPQPFAVWLFLMVCGHAGISGITVSRALDWQRGAREQPVRWVVALAATTLAAAVTAVSTAAHGPVSEGVATTLCVGIVSFGTGISALGLRGTRQMLWDVLGGALGAGAVGFLQGFSAFVALLTIGVVLLGAGFVTFTCVFSVWLLGAVYRLDEARDTRARLAVAEERLRFGRDLHDVIGRNLAVIALKSELAVQLSQRGRAEAVEQMIEVQRLARESQREVREVVRGYREADLSAELAGARGVLTAAGIDCTVTGSADGLPSAVQSTLGWVVREAATNVLRHGDARRCAVLIQVKEGLVVLSVENDGVPQDAEPRPSGGSGLAGLGERLAEIGGTLRAAPTGDGRFRLAVEVPLPSGSRAARSLSEVTP